MITSKVKCAHSDQISWGFRVGHCYVQILGPATIGQTQLTGGAINKQTICKKRKINDHVTCTDLHISLSVTNICLD